MKTYRGPSGEREICETCDNFFDAPPLNPREARRLEGKREATRRNDAHDETGSMSEDEERERSEWPR